MSTAGEMARFFAELPPDTPVRIVPARSSGVTSSVCPKLDDAFESKYGYLLPMSKGYRPDKGEKIIKAVFF